jgi:hypothetical protein
MVNIAPDQLFIEPRSERYYGPVHDSWCEKRRKPRMAGALIIECAKKRDYIQEEPVGRVPEGGGPDGGDPDGGVPIGWAPDGGVPFGMPPCGPIPCGGVPFGMAVALNGRLSFFSTDLLGAVP